MKSTILTLVMVSLFFPCISHAKLPFKKGDFIRFTMHDTNPDNDTTTTSCIVEKIVGTFFTCFREDIYYNTLHVIYFSTVSSSKSNCDDYFQFKNEDKIPRWVKCRRHFKK